MKNVQSFINNISFPATLEELIDYHDDGLYDVEKVLAGDETSWTAPRWCKIGDIVFFMHTKQSALLRIRDLSKNLEAEQWKYSDEEYEKLQEWLEHGKEIHKKYGGKIFAIARVAGEPEIEEEEDDDDNEENENFSDEGANVDYHHLIGIYADMDNFYLLQTPVDISEFRDFIQIAMQGTITAVFGDAFEKLKKLIISKNPDVPEYFREAEAVQMPLAKINRENWIELGGLYRREFFLELQFKKYYVNYFLSALGDNKTFFHDCRCQKAGMEDAFVDNVIRFNKKYIPVEIKLNIDSEENLLGELQKYCNNGAVYSRRDNGKLLPFKKFYANNVLVFDTENIYLYDNRYDDIRCLINLDDIKTESDIQVFREKLIGSLSNIGLTFNSKIIHRLIKPKVRPKPKKKRKNNKKKLD